MNDDWDRRVRIIRTDGSERTLPLAAWTDDLEQRCLQAGCKVIKPVDEEQHYEPPAPAPLSEAVPVPSQREEDLGLVEVLCSFDKGLTPWEVDFVDSLSRWLDDYEVLTDRQRATAKKILWDLEGDL